MSKDVFSIRIGGEYTYPSAIAPPVTVAFHAHAQSPKAAELIAHQIAQAPLSVLMGVKAGVKRAWEGMTSLSPMMFNSQQY